MDKKKKIAAVSAVMQYVKSEEEMLMMQAAAEAGPEVAPAAVPPNLWGISGRQTMMQMQNLMQFKAFHGTSWR